MLRQFKRQESPIVLKILERLNFILLELLKDVHMKVKVELGRGRMYLKDILRLGQGSVVELERLAGDPLDIYVNEKVIARGEGLVLNENFCIRIRISKLSPA